MKISAIQKYGLDLWEDDSLTELMLGGSAGGPQPLDSKIMTPFGSIKIGDAKVGNVILGADGKRHTIIDIPYEGIRDIYEVEFSDGSRTKCADNHIWKVKTRHSKKDEYILKTTLQIKEQLSKGYHGNQVLIPLTQPAKFESTYQRYIKIHPYLLGVLLGDGCISQKKHVLLSTADDFILEKARLLYEKPIKRRCGKYDYALLQNQEIREDLEYYGLMGTKSYNKFIPEHYKFSSIEQRYQLLQGLFDTDGCVNNIGNITYSTASAQLANDVRDIIRSLGGIATINVHKTKKRDSYRLYIQHPNKEKLFSLPRKVEKIKQYNGGRIQLHARIKSIQKIGKDKVKCISTSAIDGLYLTDDYIVTHNSKSWLMCLLALMSCRNGEDVSNYIFRRTTTSLKDSTMKTLLTEVHPAFGLREGKDYVVKDMGTRVLYANGSSISFRSLDFKPSDPDFASIGSLLIDNAFIDEAGELPMVEIKDAINSRVGRGKYSQTMKLPGKLIVSANPSQNFLRKEYYEPYVALGGGRFQKWENGTTFINDREVTAYRGFLRFGATDNPFLSKAYIARLKALPLKERKRLLDGNWDYNDDSDSLFTQDSFRKSLIHTLPEPIYVEKVDYSRTRNGEPIKEKILKFSKTIGCLPPGEKIKTTTGFKAIEDVSLDDLLIDSSGLPQKIQNKQIYKYKGSLFKIRLNCDYRETLFTGEHPVVVSSSFLKKEYWKREDIAANLCEESLLGKEKSMKWVHSFDFREIRDVKVGDWVKYPILYREEKDFPEYSGIDKYFKLEDFWWLVGFWLGDGWTNLSYNKSPSHKKPTTISFGINPREKDLVEFFKKKLLSLNKKPFITKKMETCWEFGFCSVKIAEFLRREFGYGAINKNIPEWVKYIPKKYKIALVAGFLDSDGSLFKGSPKKKNCSPLQANFESISEKLIIDVSDIIKSLGVPCSVNRLPKFKGGYGSGEGFIYTINIFGLPLYKLLKDADSVRKNRVSEEFKTLKEYKQRKRYSYVEGGFLYSRVLRVEQIPDYKGNVFNFETETHTYLTENLITHNCDVADSGKDKTVVSLIDNGVLVDIRPLNVNKDDDKAVARLYAEELIKYAQKNGFTPEYARNIGIEENGVGQALCAMMEERGWHITRCTATSKSRSENYYNLYLDMDSCQVRIYDSLENYDSLKNQLLAHTASFDTGKCVVCSKEKVRRSIGMSPDFADSFAWANYMRRIIPTTERRNRFRIARL